MIEADDDGVIKSFRPKPFIRSPYNYDVVAASREVALHCDPEDTQVQQQFKEECDINTIIKRFGLTGELPEGYQAPQSGDFTGITDFHSAMNAVRAAEEAFMEMPAELRARFAHDPQRLMDFLDDPKNRDEAIKLGLVNKPVEPARDMVKAIDELSAKFVPTEKK